MKSDLVNILLATYNGETYLSGQIESILAQTHENHNILVRDDGSTDQTVQLIQEYQKKYPTKIITIVDKNKTNGAAKNFLTLLSHSNAPYIMFSDQDDYWLPEKVEKSLQLIQELEKKHGKSTPILIHTDLKVVDQDLNINNPSFWNYAGIKPENTSLNRLLVQNVITGCTVMINQSLARISISIPENILMHDWWLGLLASSTGIVSYLNEATVLYRQHPQNLVGAKMTVSNTIQLLKKMIETFTRTEGYLPGYIHQAEELASICWDQMPDKNKQILKNFIDLKKQGFFLKRINLIRHNFLKGKLLQAIGQVIKF